MEANAQSVSAEVECPFVFAKLATPESLAENAVKFSEGKLEVVDIKTGRRFVLRQEMATARDPDPKLMQETMVTNLTMTGVAPDGQVVEIGMVRTRFKTKTKELEISNVAVYPSFNRQQISTIAIGEAMKGFPEAKAVTAKLVGDNAKGFMAAIKKARAEGRKDALLLGFKGTPLYKSLQAHGFTEVDMNSSYFDPTESQPIDQLFIKLRKP